MTPDDVRAEFERFINGLPGAEPRPGQVAMAEAVARAIVDRRHVMVEAGTGTGKSFAYLVPCVLLGSSVVVTTATKALQEQLVHVDLPLLERHLGVPFEAALLKGRSNYLCRAALAELTGEARQGTLLDDGGLGGSRVRELAAWAATTDTGDRADLPWALSNPEWGAVSVGVGECPGAHRCRHGDDCFAEAARHRAAAADIVVVNSHLYGVHLASAGSVLPEHDVVVVDEAHAFEDVMADSLGAAVGPGRFANLARGFRGLFTAEEQSHAALDAAGRRVGDVLESFTGERVDPSADPITGVLAGAAETVATAQAAVRSLDVDGEGATRKERLLQLSTGLLEDLRSLAELDAERVAWVEAGPPLQLRVAPVSVAGDLAAGLFGQATVVLTSATLRVGGSFAPVAERLGLVPGSDHDTLDVGSPFDYEHQALLYCAAHLPDPRAAGYEDAMRAELTELIAAAGGRTLALFTSRRAMEAAAEHADGRAPGPVLVQDRMPRPLLVSEFLADESASLFATMGFWQGFDAPGRTCSLVTIDRLPFSRPDDPLAQARREAATRQRRNAFEAVDLPRAAILLAQGAGRLIRSASDRGVVAVLDRRLASAGYRWTLVRSLPPMRRTKDPAEARAVLAAIAAEAECEAATGRTG